MRHLARLDPLLILSLVVLQLAGCGYALVGRGSSLPDDIRTVYVRPFENQTQRPQVEQFLTEAIANEMVTRQRFSVAASRAQADAELVGTVVGFNVIPVTFDSQGRATEYEISITAKVAFQRLEDEEPLWSNDRYLFRETYPVEVSQEGYFNREDIALDDASQRFAETMVSDLLEGF